MLEVVLGWKPVNYKEILLSLILAYYHRTEIFPENQRLLQGSHQFLEQFFLETYYPTSRLIFHSVYSIF